MKIFLIIFAILIFIAAVLFIIMIINSRPVSSADARQMIRKYLQKTIAGKKKVNNILLLVDSPEQDIKFEFAEGTVFGNPAAVSQRFHVASVGKLFTAVTVMLLQEQGRLTIDDRAADILGIDMLKGLFMYKDKDYSADVTVRQLLNHTSGIADYFEDPVESGDSMKELIVNEPDRLYTPQDLLDFTRNNQKAVGAPGGKLHYSDSGYILLGLIIEKVSGRTFHENLHGLIFRPLNMNDSYLMFYSEAENGQAPINEIWLEGREIHDYKSLSIDWSGGGIISTLSDLSVFIRALNSGKLINNESLSLMKNFDNRWIQGIHYGLGMMEYHFNEYMPTLKGFPRMIGHMGVLGTQMFIDPDTGLTIICSFGSTDAPGLSVRALIQVLSIIRRIS